ncbi:hypothetical protein GGR52DRAFT_572899 [Hypoxylon sp. FL1284]|nr:hypothetical protein GGR52DRAFT_572899 [Hypoxylon sp. FL1284]
MAPGNTLIQQYPRSNHGIHDESPSKRREPHGRDPRRRDPAPDGVSDADAAAVPLAFATAAQALFDRLKLPEPGRPAGPAFFPVLVNGGASSVGMYAVQLAKLAGLFVIATGSPANHAMLRALGADAVVDYRDPEWPAQVRRLSRDGLEHAFDCISVAGTYESIAEALSPAKGGHMVRFAPVAEVADKIKVDTTYVYSVFGARVKISDYDFGMSDPQDKVTWEKYLSLLPEMLSSGKIKPSPVKELGGIDSTMDRFELHSRGKVRAEKLVYKIDEDGPMQKLNIHLPSTP